MTYVVFDYNNMTQSYGMVSLLSSSKTITKTLGTFNLYICISTDQASHAIAFWNFKLDIEV